MRRLIWWALLFGCAPDGDPEARPDPAEHTDFLPVSACAQCHPRQAEEFRGSAMAYAAFSPVFNALELLLAEAHGRPFAADAEGDAANLCGRCHAPVAAARGVGADGRVHLRARLESALDDGITCDYCHRVEHAGVANTRLEATPGVVKRGPIADPVANGFHEAEGDPDLYRSGALCGGCHDVRLPRTDVTRPDEPFARLENLFTEWRASPWADADHPQNPLRGQPGIGALHDPAAGEVVTCNDCHMSLYPARRFEDAVPLDVFAGVDPAALGRKADKLYPAGLAALEGSGVDPLPRRRVSTHAFAAASNPMVPFPLASDVDYADALVPLPPALYGPDPDPALAEARATAEAHARTGLEPGCDDAADAHGRPLCALQRRAELLRAAVTLSLDETPGAVAPREDIEVRAWVENVGAGHNVPAGFSQEREVWLELTVLDEGRPCAADADCADLVEPRRFPHDAPLDCFIDDPAVAGEGPSRDARARAERSGVCHAELDRCVVYRSGYLVDHDGDGRTHDEDLRHVLVDLDADDLSERCVTPGPDVDQRPTGVAQGIVRFTNSFQRVAVEDGEPEEARRSEHLRPTTEPPPVADAPVLDQDPAERRTLAWTERARYGEHRYRTGAPGLPPAVDSPLHANRYFNDNALAPFRPRLARYVIGHPEGVVGPLRINARLRFRFFPPRLLRALAEREAARGTGLVTEAMIDRYLAVVDMATASVRVEVSRRAAR